MTKNEALSFACLALDCAFCYPCGNQCFDEITVAEAKRIIAALSAPASKPEAWQQDLIQLLISIRPQFGAVGSRDVDVKAQQEQIDAAISLCRCADVPAKALTDIDCKDFYELMQTYRHAPLEDQKAVCDAYQAVIDYVRSTAGGA